MKIPRPKFEEMCSKNQCSPISEGYVLQTVFWMKKEYVITGTMSSGAIGYICAWGHEVVDIEYYTDDIQPLNSSEHFKLINEGKRERGYRGQISKLGDRTIVFSGERVQFEPSSEGTQATLF